MAFSAAVAVDGGRIVDGLGGSAGPIGARACGALDAEVAYLLGGALSKRTVFSGGALDPRGELDLSAGLAELRRDPRHREGWLALEEGAAKAALALTVSAPAPREILVAGRLAQAPGVIEALGERLAAVAPVRAVAGVGAAPAPPRTARRCWPTAWREAATRRSSSAWAWPRRAAPRSTTSGCTAPTRFGCADHAATSSHSRIDV